MLILQNLFYSHAGRSLLFSNISLAINKHQKLAIVGNNGAGKSTLLKIMAGLLQPQSGTVTALAKPYYVPQHFGQYNALTIAQALLVDEKLKALHNILNGHVTDYDLSTLGDDWDIEERCAAALAHWQLSHLSLQRPLSSLSGGQKTKVFLAGVDIHQPKIILLDEPSNHLDAEGRALLYAWIKSSNSALVVVSHDRPLLHLMESVVELDKKGLTLYGGNYNFYKEQKQLARQALEQQVKSTEKALRKARETEREAIERKQKLDARGRKKQQKAGLPTILLKTFKNNAEKSAARLKNDHEEKTNAILDDLNELRDTLPDFDKMKLRFDNTALHKGKVLIDAVGINFGYDNKLLLKTPLHFKITSGSRLAIKGANGAGKTTLIKILLGELAPATGQIERADFKAVYIDQDYALIDNSKTVEEQAQSFNSSGLQDHEVKLRLNRFLFAQDGWDKNCGALSGGEKMRLALCCLSISGQAPGMMVLDEPTNNLDLQNIEILVQAINQYDGALIVVSHDTAFLQDLGIQQELLLE